MLLLPYGPLPKPTARRGGHYTACLSVLWAGASVNNLKGLYPVALQEYLWYNAYGRRDKSAAFPALTNSLVGAVSP